MKTVKWVDVKIDGGDQKTDDENKQVKMAVDSVAPPRPAKHKVIETEPEPPFTLITGTTSEIQLVLNAVADYAKYELNMSKIFFKDTLMFQTRLYRWELVAVSLARSCAQFLHF